MNSFSGDYLKRESLISCSSSLSEDSEDSQFSFTLNRSKLFDDIIEDNQKESQEKISCSEEFLFFGPLILCLILLISGIILFLIVEQRNNKHQNKEIELNNPFNRTLDDDFMPILCSFNQVETSIQSQFALNQLKCALRRSSLIHIYYSNNRRPIHSGENLTMEDVILSPLIQLDKEYLSKVNTKSFVLILIDPILVPNSVHTVLLHWIRYISLSLEDEEDICYYKYMSHRHIYSLQKLFLLYATNSSQMMIRAKTICNEVVDPFQLTEYITFIQLKLIASTHFFIPFVPTLDE